MRAVAVLFVLSALAAAMGEVPRLLPPGPPGATDSLPDPPGPIVKGPSGKIAAGDTLIYTISWGPGARATSYSYRLSVTATNGTWTLIADSNSAVGKFTSGTLLPDVRNVTPTLLKTWLSAIPWDSATFTVSVSSQNAAGTSASVATTWKVLRKPGPPSQPVVDSSLTVTATLVQPPTATLTLNSSRIFCAFKQFSSGAVAQWTADKAACDSIYIAYVPATARGAVTAAQQAHTDSLTQTCVTWTASAALGLTPRATCAASVTVKGLAITMRPDNTQFRNVGLVPNDAPVLAHLGNGRILCLRVGLGYATAYVGRVQRSVPIACNAVASVFLALR